nr:MAG: RNA-dependent RNA polymerase [Polycipiviridae sp. XZN141292]
MARRKFGLTGMLSQVPKESGFIVKISPSLRKRFLFDLCHKRLYLCGSPNDLNFSYGLEEVLSLVSEARVRAADVQISRRLWGIPLFFSLEYQTCNGSISSPGPKTFVELMSGYEACEAGHKRIEFHHPDSETFVTSTAVTIECVFDVFSSLLRNASLETSFSRLLQVLKTAKFSKLCPLGVYYAFMHILIRGVANAPLFRQSSQWRYKTPERLQELHRMYESGLVCESEIAFYRRETWLHAVSIRQELSRLRFPRPNHDYTKFWTSMIWYYSWRWGVYEQMSLVQRHRIASKCEVTYGFPTMIKSAISTSIAEGINRTAPTVREHIDYASDRFITSFESSCLRLSDRLVEETSNKIGERFGDLSTDLQNLLQDCFRSAGNFKTEVLDGLQTRFDPFLKSAVSSMDGMTGVISLLSAQLASLLETASKLIFNPLGLTDVKVDLPALLEAFKYLVFYLNVENKFLKTMCFVQILRYLGILGYAFTYFKSLWSYLTADDELADDMQRGEPTFDVGSLMNLLSTPYKLIKYIVLLVVSVAKGSPLSSLQVGSLLKSVSGMMRNFHFIGGGILGIERICSAIKSLYVKVSEWIMENFFGRIPARRELAKRVSKWILLIRYFSTEAGITAVRANSKVLKRAEALFSEGQALVAELSEPSERADKFLLSQVQRYWRNSQQLASMIHRIRAASTFEPTMFHVQFVGETGVGKSHQTRRFVQDLLQNIWSADEVNSFWAFNPNLEYYDGYAGQKIMMVDDMFRFNEPKHLTSLIGLVTNVPIILPMANLEDKGIQMTSSILVTSTNTPYPIGKDVYCMEAVYRRRHLLVHVTCDRRVINPEKKTFCEELFKKYYPGEDSCDYPHLRYHLLKPVPSSVDELEVLRESSDYYPQLIQRMELVEGANNTVRSGRRLVDPAFFFVEHPPPAPLPVPCENWTYDEFLINAKARYLAFRGSEGGLSAKEKFGHVELCLSEIDNIYNRVDMFADLDVPLESSILRFDDLVELPNRHALLSDYFTEMLHPFGFSDPLSQRVWEGDEIIPELLETNFDQIVSDVIDEAEASTSAEVSTNPFDGLDDVVGEPTVLTLTQEMERARRIRERRPLVCPYMSSRLRMERIVRGETERKCIRFHPGFTVWDFMVTSHDQRMDARVQRMHEFFRAPNNMMQFVTDSVDIYHLQRNPALQLIPGNSGHDYITAFSSALFSSAMSSMAVIPKADCFPRDMWGLSTGIPLWFMKRLFKLPGDVNWYLDLDDFPHYSLGSMNVSKNGQEFSLVVNTASLFFFVWHAPICNYRV